MVLLKNRDLFTSTSVDENFGLDDCIDYPLLTLDKLENPRSIENLLMSYALNEELKDVFIDLEPYVNQSAVSIPDKFSLERTYIIFRTLGLRHMTVTDELNHVVGIITRKDLMGFNMEEKLTVHANPERHHEYSEQEDEMLLLAECR
jgi:chloride channel 7